MLNVCHKFNLGPGLTFYRLRLSRLPLVGLGWMPGVAPWRRKETRDTRRLASRDRSPLANPLSYQQQPLLARRPSLSPSPCISCSPSWWAPAWPCRSGRAHTPTSPTRWPGCRCKQGTTVVAAVGTLARKTLSATWLGRNSSRTRTLTETSSRILTRSFHTQSLR